MADNRAYTASEEPLQAGGPTIDVFSTMIRGSVLRPADGDFEEARRVWNGMIDRHPSLIVRPRNAADVVRAVEFGRGHEMPIAVRCGGHNVAGTAICDDGLVIDLSLMRGVRMDPERQTVRVSGGALLGDMDRETFLFGRAVPVGVVSATGIGGLALHGGMGLLTRRNGLTSDNLVSADVVTADGRLITADANNHPDLFWALRGGGGCYGIVTSFEFRTHSIPPDVMIGLTMYAIEDAPAVMKTFRDVMSAAPDGLSALAIYWTAPVEEHVPEEYHGRPVILFAACWSGDPAEGERALLPLRHAAMPVADLSSRMPYLEAQQLFDPEYPNGRRYYWKSVYINDLTDDVIRIIGEAEATRPSMLSSIDVWALGGAFARVDPSETAFFRRDAPFMLGVEANWEDPDDDGANVAWVRKLVDDVNTVSPAGAYLNFPGFLEEGDDLLTRSFGPNLERLRKVKREYDPTNLFPFNLRIAATP